MNKLWHLKCLFTFILLIGSFSQAQESAVRQPHEDWQTALSRSSFQRPASNGMQTFALRRSAIGSAKYYHEQLDISALPQWTGSDLDLQNAFERLRDERPYIQANRPDFPRRATWLFPRDGCYARAAHSASSFEKASLVRPGKIFAFGNLKIRPSFAPKSTVYWSYHVAAAFRIGDRAVVMDPAVEALHPLLLEEWLSRFSSRIQNVRVAVCDSYAYSPGSVCVGGSARQEGGFRSHLVSFLPKEWNYLMNLRLNPERLVGNEPPWSARRAPNRVHPIREAELD